MLFRVCVKPVPGSIHEKRNSHTPPIICMDVKCIFFNALIINTLFGYEPAFLHSMPIFDFPIDLQYYFLLIVCIHSYNKYLIKYGGSESVGRIALIKKSITASVAKILMLYNLINRWARYNVLKY